jgi:nucleotide-binding universal stress UspA family protein
MYNCLDHICSARGTQSGKEVSMALADILVHMDPQADSAARLAVAIGLAKQHRAKLTGLYVITHQFYQPRQDADNASAGAARALFEERVARAGIEGQWQCIDWSVIGVGMTEIIIHHAHYCDLLIIGQTEESAVGGGVPADLPERLILGAGRPVLVVPYAGEFPSVGERVLVAWKAGRESTRAVNDALPILKKAKRVNILAINSSETYGDDGESLCGGICAHLARHSVTARAESMMVTGTSVGDALLNRISEEGFDLLVMGAYAHTPQGKMVLGSVASQLLAQMTVPVLMSH